MKVKGRDSRGDFDRSERKVKQERKKGKVKKHKRQFQNIVKQGRYEDLEDYNDY